MAQIIDVPGQGEVEFPDGMTDQQIVTAIKALSAQSAQPSKPAGNSGFIPGHPYLSAALDVPAGLLETVAGGIAGAGTNLASHISGAAVGAAEAARGKKFLPAYTGMRDAYQETVEPYLAPQTKTGQAIANTLGPVFSKAKSAVQDIAVNMGSLQALALQKLGLNAQEYPEAVREGAGAMFDIGLDVAPFTKTGREVLGAPLQPLKYAAGKAVDWAYPSNRNNLAGKKLFTDAADGQMPAVIKALEGADPRLTASQAIANSMGNSTPRQVAALGELTKRWKPDDYAAIKGRQDLANQQAVARTAGGATQEASMSTQAAMKEALRTKLDPMRERGVDSANATTRYIENLKRGISESRLAAEQKVADVRRFTAAGDRASGKGAESGSPYMSELANKAENVATLSAADSIKQGHLARLKESIMENYVDANGLASMKGDSLLGAIDDLAGQPYNRTNPNMTKALKGLKSYVEGFVKKDWTMDAADAHGIRQNINEIVSTLLPDVDNSFKQRAVGVISKLKPVIDTSLKNAGGTELLSYMDKYAKGSDKIRQIKMAAKAMELSKANPQAFKKLTSGDSPDLVSDVFGPSNISFGKQMGGKGRVLSTVADRMARDNSLVSMADDGANALTRTLNEDARGLRLPWGLSREVAAANKIFEISSKALSKGKMENVSKKMQSPQATLEMINQLPAAQRIQALQMLPSIFG